MLSRTQLSVVSLGTVNYILSQKTLSFSKTFGEPTMVYTHISMAHIETSTTALFTLKQILLENSQ